MPISSIFEKTLDVAFVSGAMVNIIKLGDLALRPHQQKRLQDWCENKALKLSYLKPLNWFQKLTTPKASRILLLIGVAEFLVVSIIARFMSSRQPSVSNSERWTQVIALVLSLLTLPYVVQKLGPRFIQWLFSGRDEKDPEPKDFIVRFMLMIVGGFGVLIVYQVVVLGVMWVAFHNQTSGKNPIDLVDQSPQAAMVFNSLMLVCWPFFTFFWIVTQVGGLAMWCITFLYLAEWTLKFARGFAWRVVEYNKGAFAALTLVATVAIGLADFVIKTTHQK